jgi:hypothetical protein
MILLFSASQVARIIGMRHRHLAKITIYYEIVFILKKQITCNDVIYTKTHISIKFPDSSKRRV